jgi:PD-(D/E)XK nuclease superfamily
LCVFHTSSAMPLLSEINSHPRDERIVFYDEGHRYAVDGKSDGYISCTTFIHELFPKFDADAVITKIMRSRNWPNSQWHGMSRQEIKDAWSTNGSTAASLGTAMHANIEQYYNGLPHSTDSEEWKLFEGFLADHPDLVPYRTEMCVFADDAKIAGSVDMIYKDGDGYIICDWKRSKEIKMSNKWERGTHPLTEDLDSCNFVHYSMQLSLYKYILQKYYGMTITQTFLIILHPNQDSYMKVVTMDLCDIVHELVEQRIDDNKENITEDDVVLQAITGRKRSILGEIS